MVIDKQMTKLGEWAKGKPLGLVIFAQQAAVGAEPLFKWLKSIKGEELLRDHITAPTFQKMAESVRKGVACKKIKGLTNWLTP